MLPEKKESISFQLLTEKQVAEILGISVQTLRNERCQGKGLPYIKRGRSVRYIEEDVYRDILAHKIVTEPRTAA